MSITSPAPTHNFTIRWIAPGGDISPALELRCEVFGGEFGYINEGDELDAGAHTLLILEGDRVAACGRIATLSDGRTKFGKIAVRRSLRGQQLGRRVMAELERRAVELGRREVFLSAQLPALGFYLHLGYLPRGAQFPVQGKPHQDVVKSL